MNPCVKQLTRCEIVLNDGTVINETNKCLTDGDTCPRVEAGCETGTGYELCGSTHAEANAAALVPDDNVGGVAQLFGHTWMCGPCQHALTAKGIRVFIITGRNA